MDLSSTSTVPEPRSSNLNPDPSLDRNMTPSSPSHCQDDQASSTSAFSDYFKTTPTFTASATPSTTATSYSTTAYVDDDVTTANHPSRDSCDRRRPNDGDASKFPANMPTQLVGQTVTPFLREHIPGIYAPIGKPDIQNENSNNYNNSNGTNNSGHLSQTRDANSKFCYRHRPDAKCRRAADESKMVLIQSELDKLPSADQQAITHV
ncbi:hypothetical protein CH063_04450, partial [Colletotrichum higginsianum]